MSAVILDLLIPAQSLGHTWDLPTGTPAETELPAVVYSLSPRAFNPVQCGRDFTGQSHGVGLRVEAEDEWLVEVRGVGWAPSSGWSSLLAKALC